MPLTERVGSLAGGRPVTLGSTERGADVPSASTPALATNPLGFSACCGVSDWALVGRTGVLYDGLSMVVSGVRDVECAFGAGPETCCAVEELNTELELS